jgi:hypothetical protein
MRGIAYFTAAVALTLGIAQIPLKCGLPGIEEKIELEHSTENGASKPKKPKPLFTNRPLNELVDEYIDEHEPRRINRHIVENHPDRVQRAVVFEKKLGSRIVTVYFNGDPIKKYKVGHSGNLGDKRKEGDEQTPNGIFFVTRNSDSIYHHALVLSYPLIEDADRAFPEVCETNPRNSRCKITKRQYEKIEAAHKSCRRPPQDKGYYLGSWLEFHGNNEFHPNNPSWTTGCVALTNKEIDEIAAFVEYGCHGYNEKHKQAKPITPFIIVDGSFTPQKVLPFEELAQKTLGGALLNGAAQGLQYDQMFLMSTTFSPSVYTQPSVGPF